MLCLFVLEYNRWVTRTGEPLGLGLSCIGFVGGGAGSSWCWSFNYHVNLSLDGPLSSYGCFPNPIEIAMQMSPQNELLKFLFQVVAILYGFDGTDRTWIGFFWPIGLEKEGVCGEDPSPLSAWTLQCGRYSVEWSLDEGGLGLPSVFHFMVALVGLAMGFFFSLLACWVLSSFSWRW